MFMQGRIIRAIAVALWLSLLVLGGASAQLRSPLTGIPHMSDEPDGPVMEKFPSETEKVYLVFEYETEAPTKILVEVVSEAEQGARIFVNDETYEGSGTVNLEIEGPGSDPFPDGVYDTLIKVGDERYPTAGWEWAVGDVELPPEDTSGAQTPMSSSVEGPGSAQQQSSANAAPAADTSASAQSAASVETTAGHGLSPVILGGVAIIVLILLGVIAWAVRGFMTTAA